jgi:hypothetical protein
MKAAPGVSYSASPSAPATLPGRWSAARNEMRGAASKQIDQPEINETPIGFGMG